MTNDESVTNWISVLEASRQASVPEANIRRYVSKFPEYIPQKKQGRVRLIKSNSCQIIKEIASLYKKGISTPGIENELREKYSRTFDVNRHGITIQRASIFEAKESFVTNDRHDSTGVFELAQTQAKSFAQIIEKQNRTLSELISTRKHTNELLLDLITEIRADREDRNIRLTRLEEQSSRYEKEIKYMTKAWFTPKKPWWKRIFKKAQNGNSQINT